MRYLIGDKISVKINKIQENGCYCSFFPLSQNQFGFMPKYLMGTYINEDGEYIKEVGDTIIAVIYNITERGILLSDIKSYEKELDRQKRRIEKEKQKILINDFASQYEIGTIFEAEVVKVKKSFVEILLGEVPGIIKKEDTNWNEINKLEDLLFEGETIQAVYIKNEKEQLYFSLKVLNEKPYEEGLYDLSLKELLNFTGHDSNIFIGKAKKYHYGWFLENLYSDKGPQKGKLLVDPIFGYNLRAIVPNNFIVEDDKYYRFELRLVPKDRRIERNQLFQFTAINLDEAENPYKEDVKLAFQRNTTNPSSNQRDAKLLDEIGKNMYSSKDRMFFELIQNADDAASQKGVLINVKTIGDYLVIKHNGLSFDKDDFVSITTAANGTKKANENKTGYKGIGFKSVFTDSTQVFISTGGYRFKFDKNEPIFKDFDRFYLENNPLIINEETRNNFLRLYSENKRQFEGIRSIPWQLEPIWIDNFPLEIGDDFTLSNVSIALRLGENHIFGNNGYRLAIEEIIRNPKFMLFLRNTRRINFNGLSVSKKIKDDIIILKNSFSEERVEYFKRIDFEIDVNNEIFENNDIDIRIKIEEQDDNSGKIIEAKFVDLQNQELENIPKKIAISKSTLISFAIPINEYGYLIPDKNCSEISMFAYLPTLVKDFKFPFYINANFILDPPRQRILGDNPWNFYLMQEIGKKIVEWSAILSKQNDENALNILIPNFFEEDSPDTKQLAEYFNRSYKNALESDAFILNHQGKLSKQAEIVLDTTGLSEIIGDDLFCELVQPDKFLPAASIDHKILEQEIFDLIEILRFEDVIHIISKNYDFNKWIINCSTDEKENLYEWININNTALRLEDIKTFVSNLPLFKFGEEYKSFSEIDPSKYIINTENIDPIKEILSKLGFICSDNIINKGDILEEILDLIDEESIFNSIKECDFKGLNTEERKILFFALSNFGGVGSSKLGNLVLFRNMKGECKPLNTMIEYREDAPDWLYPFIILKEDYCEELSKHLTSQEDEFSVIIQKNYKDINISFIELYNYYSEEWTGQFTREIIDNFEVDDNFLSIIEKSDDKTKEYFLNKLKNIELHSGKKYKETSFEYRVLQLVLSLYDNPSDFSQKIYFDEKCIKEYTVSDEVICEYNQGGNRKKIKMSLSQILPSYKNQSDTIKKIVELFDKRKDLDQFFNVSSKKNFEISKELNTYLGIPEAYFSEWNVKGNAYQYLFATYYRRCVKNWNNAYVPKINLSNETSEFINELLDFLYDNDIAISDSPFTYHLREYFDKKYFYCDYISDSEKIFTPIELWASDDKKKEYLIKNGVLSEECNTIQFRKLFIENQTIDFIEKLSTEDLRLGLEFIASVNGIERPFKGNVQKEILLDLKGKIRLLLDKRDIESIKVNSSEWTSPEYEEWKASQNTRIFIHKGLLSSQLIYNDQILLNYDDIENKYFYDNINKNIYLTDMHHIEELLFELIKDKNIYFDIDDYRTLCLEGKVSITKEEINNKDKEIQSLSEKLLEKEEIIERYKARFGKLEDADLSQSQEQTIKKIDSSEVLNKMHSYAQEELYIQSGKIIERDDLSIEKQIAAHREAEKTIKDELQNNGYDCSNWLIDETEADNSFNKWQSYSQVKDVINPDGEKINLVVKSAKGGYIYLSATDFEFLTSNCKNVLMVWDGCRVHSVTSEDIFNKDSNVNLIFDTEYTPKHYYAALSTVFKYVRRTTFAVKNPQYSAYEAIKTFGLDSKTEGVQDLFDDNDI